MGTLPQWCRVIRLMRSQTSERPLQVDSGHTVIGIVSVGVLIEIARSR